MPCLSYESQNPNFESEALRKINDKLARIAFKALTVLENHNVNYPPIKEIQEVLNDPEIAKWWKQHKLADENEQRQKRKERKDKEEKRVQESA